MTRSKTTIRLSVIALALTLATSVFGHGNATVDGLAIEGQKVKVQGLVIKRDDDTFTMRSSDGSEKVVLLTGKTKIRINRRFRSDQTTAASAILRGLRLKVEGTGNTEGQVVATKIGFDQRDLLTAQSLDSRVSPVEDQANSTAVLAESNEKRIDNAQERIEAADKNAQRLAGQVEELSAVAEEVGAEAKKAQATADRAQTTADTANDRVTSLDDYSVFRTITIHFRTGSASLSKSAKQEIDQEIEALSIETLKGFKVSVVGFADSTGTTAKNRTLSNQRADAVINYLVTQHNVPLQRVVQPFGYGSLNPVSRNDTSAGRTLNRRAEVRILINKGVTQASL
jgi:outer membrane protein OmpA-like peptidoglycan-associated protein